LSSSDTPTPWPRLHAVAASEATRIHVTDANFQPVPLPDNAGEVEVALVPGIYEVAFVDSNARERHLVALRAGATAPVEVIQAAQSPVTRTARQAWQGSITPLSVEEPDPGTPGGLPWPTDAASPGDLLVVVYDKPDEAILLTEGTPPAPHAPGELAKGLALVSADGSTVLEGRSLPGATPDSEALHFSLPPGLWRLRLHTGLGHQALETPVVACPGWATTMHLLAVSYGKAGNRRADLARAQLRMFKPGYRPEPLDQHSRRLEANALRALMEDRELRGKRFDGMLRSLLTAEFDYPMLGIYGGYLVARRLADRKQGEDLSLLADVVEHLDQVTRRGPYKQLEPPSGFRHPDVAALKLQLALVGGASADDIDPFVFPPMLMSGWRILLEAARERPWLVPPGSLSDRIAARLVAPGPAVAWSLPPESPKSPPRDSADVPDLAEDRARIVVGVHRRMAAPLEPRMAVALERAAGPPPVGISRGADAGPSFGHACTLIDTALHHAKLREWFRTAYQPATKTSTASTSVPAGTAPVVDPAERMLAQAVHPVAAQEENQAELEASRRTGAVATTPVAQEIGRLVEALGLPPATLERAALGLAADLVVAARRFGIDLDARTPMAQPEIIVPYDPLFLGDGFNVPLPRLGDTLRASALYGGEVINYTYFSLVMHATRRVAIYTAHNVDAARMVRVRERHPWQMDERVGEFQLGPEVYDSNQLDRGHLVRRGDVLWGSLAMARAANRATFFYTNAAPQHQNFNQDEWVALEDWVLHQATDLSYRLCIFTGPVLRGDDPVLEDLPPNLRTAFHARGPAQIPAAFWKIIVLRDSTAGGEDLSAVAFAMRQSEMWNDKEGKRLLNLKVHQVTLEAIEGWTGLDFGALKQVDELAWSEERARLRDAGTEPAWPAISDASDVVFTGPFRRRRGLRALRSGARDGQPRQSMSEASRQGMGELRQAAECGCSGGGTFDARAAVAALARDLAQLADTVASHPQQANAAPATGGPRAAAAGGAGGARSGAGPVTLPPEAEERIEATVAAAPEPLKERARSFARRVAEQAEIARGRATAPTPTEVTRIVGGDLVPAGGFPECCCIGDATDWFCTGVMVAPQVVLTAAHCGAQISRVLLKGNNVRQIGSDSLVVPVRQAVIHPDYRAHPRNENDISVLILARPAGVAPVPIATPKQLRDAAQVRLVGFGYNDPVRPVGFGLKRQVTVDMGFLRVSPDETDLEPLEQLHGFHAAYEFTAGRKALGRDTCNGDSGGPAYLILGADGSRAVAGLTSRATRDAIANCGDGGIYVRPDQFYDWISSVMRSAGLSPLPQ
jgi:endonuclease G